MISVFSNIKILFLKYYTIIFFIYLNSLWEKGVFFDLFLFLMYTALWHNDIALKVILTNTL